MQKKKISNGRAAILSFINVLIYAHLNKWTKTYQDCAESFEWLIWFHLLIPKRKITQYGVIWASYNPINEPSGIGGKSSEIIPTIASLKEKLTKQSWIEIRLFRNSLKQSCLRLIAMLAHNLFLTHHSGSQSYGAWI